MDVFTYAIVINLDRRPDRLKQFQDMYFATALGTRVPLRRQAAIEGASLPLDRLLTDAAAAELADFAQLGKRLNHAQLTPGAVGCYCSHLQAWQAVAAADGPVLVFEDDIIVTPRFGMDTYAYILHLANLEAQRSPDVPWMLHMQYACPVSCTHRTPYAVETIPWLWGMGCYMLTPQSAAGLLRLLPKLVPMDVQIDTRLSQLQEEGLVRLLGTRLFGTRSHGSDIQEDILPMAPLTRDSKKRPSSDPCVLM